MFAANAVPRSWPRRWGAGAALLLLALGGSSLCAQDAAAGSVTGLMLSEKGGAPFRYARVTLTGSAGSGAALTDQQGAFEFRDVPPGDYRVRLELLGFEADSGVALHVAPGQRQDLVLRAGAPRPLQIPATGTPSPVCYPGTLLERAPVLAALWVQAQRPARNRRLFDLTYDYRTHVSEKLQNFYRLRLPEDLGPAVVRKHDLHSTPELARLLAARGSFAGYGVGMDTSRLVAMPEMLEVLEEGYLRSNCIQALPDRDGERRIRFQPLNPDPAGTDLIGNVVLDERYILRRIEFEYQRGGAAIARGVAEFGDGDVPGGQVLFLRHMQVEMLSAPRTVGEVIDLSPRYVTAGERATVDVKYGSVQRETPGGRQ